MSTQAREEPSEFEHRISPGMYLWVLIALVVLLVLTAVASDVNLGPFNVVVAMAIAVAKAALIVTYFMHLRWSTWMVRFFAAAALFWLSIMFILSLNDYFTRAREMLPVDAGQVSAPAPAPTAGGAGSQP
jgi:cytochrome c oxidase subunit IV